MTSIVERDVPAAARVHDPSAVGTLLRLIAARSGALVRYDALGRDAGVDGKTTKTHIDVLERLFLVRVRRPWYVNLGKRQVKAPKVYIADPGLLAALVGADVRRVPTDDGAQDFAGLRHLRTRLGDRLAAGVVVYTGEHVLPYGERLWALPLQALWDG